MSIQQEFNSGKNPFHQLKPHLAKDKNYSQDKDPHSNFFPHCTSPRVFLLSRKLILEKGRECLQFVFLVKIDVQTLIFQPIIGVDADISLSVWIDDKGVRGVLVSVRLVDLIPAVIGGSSIAGEVRNRRNHHDSAGV